MAILAVSQFTAQHATKYHSYGYSSARVTGDIFDVRNGPDEGDQVFSVDYLGALTLGVGLPVASGGTGLSTIAAGGLIYASALDTTAVLTVGAANAVLTSNGTIPGWTAGLADAHLSASAEIAVSKLADGTARQLLQTDAGGTGVEWASNIDIPGTLDVAGAGVFDTTLGVTGITTLGAALNLENGVTPVPAYLYNTFTDGSNYERLEMEYSASGLLFSSSGWFMRTNSAGTGGDQNVQIGGVTGSTSTFITGSPYFEEVPSSPEGYLTTRSLAGQHWGLQVTNNTADVAAHAGIYIQTAASGGQPFVQIISASTHHYVQGIDTTDGNAWKFGYSTNGLHRPSTMATPIWEASTGGDIMFVNNVGSGVAASSSTFLNLGATTTAKSSFRMAHGTAPTSPVDGDMWTTTAGVFAQINSATVGPLAEGTGSGDITQVNITAGTGLTGTVNTVTGAHTQTINAVGTASRISVSADAIDIDAAYVGQTSITTLGTISTGTIPAANVSAGTFGTGAFLFDSTVGGITTLTATTVVAALTGNASTATALETSRTINGTGFDGTSNVTVTAAAGTLTGATLAAGVTASSLTSVGTIASLQATEAGAGIAPSSSTFLNLAAGTTGKSSLRAPHGVAPSTPVDGDIWTTSASGLFVRVNGVTVGPLGSSGTGDITRVDITAGVGLTGDQNTATGDHTQTIDFDASTLTLLSSGLLGTDHIVVNDGGVSKRALISGINLGQFNNDQGWSASSGGTVTTVTSGAGLDVSSPTTTPDITLDLGELAERTGDLQATDRLVGSLGTGGSTMFGETISNIELDIFSNAVSGFTTNVGTVTNVTGGTGLTSTEGATPDLAFAASELTLLSSGLLGTDHIVVADGGVSKRALVSGINLGEFSNNLGWTTNAGTVSTITSGAGFDITNPTTTPDITLDLNELITGSTPQAGDDVVYVDGTLTRKTAFSTIPLSVMNNDSGFTTNAGTVTSVGTTTGLSGTVTGSGSLSLSLNSLSEKSGNLVGTDRLVGTTGGTHFNETISNIPLGIFANNLGWTTEVGTVTSVATGVGLDGSITTSGTITLDLNELSAITLGAGDHLVVVDGTTSAKALLSGVDLGLFNNDQGWTSSSGTVTTVTAGVGLSGGGSPTPTITLDLNELSTGGTPIAGDFFVYVDGTLSRKIAMSSVPLSIFSNDSGWTSNTGDITRVNITAGNGLTGDQNTASGDHTQTINAVGTASRISVSAGAINIDTGYVGQTSITTLGTITTGTVPAARVSAGTFGTGNFVVAGNLSVTGQAYSPGQTTGSSTIDWNLGNSAHINNTGARTMDLNNPQVGASYIISIEYSSGSTTDFNWHTNQTIEWAGGTEPALSNVAGDTDIIYLYYADGRYFGNYSLAHT